MTLAVLLAAALSSAAATAPVPAAAPAPLPARRSLLPGEEKTFKSVDGWTLHAVWEKARPGKPTVVLLHGTGQRKEDWRLFARSLSRAGIGYFALDLRGHGESRTTPSGETITYKKLRAFKNVNDYEDMTRDAEAAVGSLVGGGVAEDSIGFVGAEVGGSVAAKYVAVHPKAPFLVMLSPGLAWREVPIVNAVRAFKGRPLPVLMVHSDADKRSSKETPLLYAFAKNSVGEKNATLIVVSEERGTRMLAKNKDLPARVVAWIENPAAFGPPAASTAAVSASTASAPIEIDRTDLIEQEPSGPDGR